MHINTVQQRLSWSVVVVEKVVEKCIRCLSLSVWKQNICVCLESLFRSLFVQILVVKEFACLDVTSCNKLNEINCLISFSPIVSPTVTDGIYQNQSMPLPNSNITKHAMYLMYVLSWKFLLLLQMQCIRSRPRRCLHSRISSGTIPFVRTKCCTHACMCVSDI